MATTTCNGGTNFPPPGRKVCDYQTSLREQRVTSAGKRKASAVRIHGFEIARLYKLCTLSKTKETYAYYQDLENYELFDAQQSADTIQSDVDQYIKKDGDLDTALKDGSKFNDLETKLKAANDAACAMKNCLQSILGFEEEHPPEPLSAVLASSKKLSHWGQQAATAFSTIAGKHKFANISLLKDPVGALFTDLKDLMTTADGYIRKAGDDATVAQTDLRTLLDQLNTEEFNAFEEFSTWTGLETLIEFICEGECEPIRCVTDTCLEVCGCEGETGSPPQPKPGKYTTGDRD